MTHLPPRASRVLAAFASALFLCPLSPVHAGSITVSFGPEEGKPAEYSEVNVTLFPIGNSAAAAITRPATFRSTDKSFEKTFDKLPPGRYAIRLYTGNEMMLPDAGTPGLFRYNFQAELERADSHQDVKIQYKPFDPSTVRGDKAVRGKVTDARAATPSPG